MDGDIPLLQSDRRLTVASLGAPGLASPRSTEQRASRLPSVAPVIPVAAGQAGGANDIGTRLEFEEPPRSSHSIKHRDGVPRRSPTNFAPALHLAAERFVGERAWV